MNEVENKTDPEIAEDSTVPEGMLVISENYSFRRFSDTTENREKQLPKSAHISSIDEPANPLEGKPAQFKRKTETYDLLVPTIESLGFDLDSEDETERQQAEVLQYQINSMISSFGRSLVINGTALTPDNCNYALACSDMYEKHIAGGGAKFSNDFLIDDVIPAYSSYLTALDKPKEGIEVQSKMIKSRFGAMSVRRYIEGLDMVGKNLTTWILEGCDESDQKRFGGVVDYLLDRITKAQTPDEVDVGKLF